MSALLRRLLTSGGYMAEAPADGGASAPAAAASSTPAPSSPAPSETPGAAAPAAESKPAEPSSFVSEDQKPADPPPFNADEARKYLTEKGQKAEDLAKLSDADLQKQFDQAKAQETLSAEAAKIEVKLPDGLTVDDKAMASFKEIIADAKLTPAERAQKLADMHIAALKAATEAPQTLWRETQQKWVDEIKADPVMGGKNLPETQKLFASAWSAFESQVGADVANDAKQAFAFTGAGNNPAVARFLRFLAGPFTEGSHVQGGAPADAKGKDLGARIASMYPSASGSKAA